MTKVDKAYSELAGLVKKAQEIAESVEGEMEYDPFKYIDGPIRRAMYEIRPKLIEFFNKKYMGEYTPNYEPTIEFEELMNVVVGRSKFDSNVIREWYEKVASDKKQLRDLSWEQILERAQKLRGGSHCNRPELSEMFQGQVLILRAHTWYQSSSNSVGYVSYYSKDNYEAMQSLIDVTIQNVDPIKKSENTFLTDHLENNREPEQFYGKHKVKHPVVEAFQFYKNDKLKLWFKKPQYAKMVAEQLLVNINPE